MGGENYLGDAVLFNYAHEKTLFQDSTLDEPTPIVLEGGGYYYPTHGILKEQYSSPEQSDIEIP